MYNNRKFYKKKKINELKLLREDEESKQAKDKEKVERSKILHYDIYSVSVNITRREVSYSSFHYDQYKVENYKIEDKNIYVRCTNYKYGNVKAIIDGIVQESELIDIESKNNSFLNKSDEELTEYINEFKNLANWNLLKANLVKYFILSHHKDEILDLKTYFLTERERVRVGFLKFKNYLKKNNFNFEINNFNNKRYYYIKTDEKLNNNEIEIFREKIHSDIKEYNISYKEFQESRKISMVLYLLIKKLG
jgi:hypothetical protein